MARRRLFEMPSPRAKHKLTTGRSSLSGCNSKRKTELSHSYLHAMDLGENAHQSKRLFKNIVEARNPPSPLTSIKIRNRRRTLSFSSPRACAMKTDRVLQCHLLQSTKPDFNNNEIKRALQFEKAETPRCTFQADCIESLELMYSPNFHSDDRFQGRQPTRELRSVLTQTEDEIHHPATAVLSIPNRFTTNTEKLEMALSSLNSRESCLDAMREKLSRALAENCLNDFTIDETIVPCKGNFNLLRICDLELIKSTWRQLEYELVQEKGQNKLLRQNLSEHICRLEQLRAESDHFMAVIAQTLENMIESAAKICSSISESDVLSRFSQCHWTKFADMQQDEEPFPIFGAGPSGEVFIPNANHAGLKPRTSESVLRLALFPMEAQMGLLEQTVSRCEDEIQRLGPKFGQKGRSLDHTQPALCIEAKRVSGPSEAMVRSLSCLEGDWNAEAVKHQFYATPQEVLEGSQQYNHESNIHRARVNLPIELPQDCIDFKHQVLFEESDHGEARSAAEIVSVCNTAETLLSSSARKSVNVGSLHDDSYESRCIAKLKQLIRVQQQQIHKLKQEIDDVALCRNELGVQLLRAYNMIDVHLDRLHTEHFLIMPHFAGTPEHSFDWPPFDCLAR